MKEDIDNDPYSHKSASTVNAPVDLPEHLKTRLLKRRAEMVKESPARAGTHDGNKILHAGLVHRRRQKPPSVMSGCRSLAWSNLVKPYSSRWSSGLKSVSLAE